MGRRLTADDLHALTDTTFGRWSFTYDDSGNLISKADPNSQIINYTYDDINRPKTEDFTGQAGIEVAYTYDNCPGGIGRLCSVVCSGDTESRQYNALGLASRETKLINSFSFQTDYSYDRQGNIVSIKSPDASQINYEYNLGGMIERVLYKASPSANAAAIISSFDYSPQGQVRYAQYASGAQTTNTYDATKLYRLTNKVTTVGGARVQDLSYAYDAVGNITQVTDASATAAKKTVSYTYDDLYRLTSATATNTASGQNYSQTYSYDAIGNILSKSDVGTYTYAGNTGTSYANPHAVTSIGSSTYAYDKNGNLSTISAGSSYTWDYNNRLTFTAKGASRVTYTYDYSGRRVGSFNGSSTLLYPSMYYNITNPASASPVITKHIFAGDQLIATVINGGSASGTFAVHTDHLSGSNVITNASGTVQEITDYFPFGDIRLDQKSSSFSEQRKYTGHEYDVDNGLSYMDARYYNPRNGRFLSQDMAFWDGSHLTRQLADPQSWNSYAYARNNPLVFIDPYGNMWTPWQSSGGFGNWMGNGGFLYSVYGSNVNRITNTAQNIQQYGWTADNVMGLGADAASIIAKTSGVIVGSVGIGMGGGAITNALTPGAIMTAGSAGTTACAAECDKVSRVAQQGQNLSSSISISQRALIHVLDNHSINGITNVGKSIFYENEDIVGLIRSSSQQVAKLQANGNYQRIFDVGRNVGTDLAGKPSSWLTVITNKAGDLITSHPGIPSVIIK